MAEAGLDGKLQSPEMGKQHLGYHGPPPAVAPVTIADPTPLGLFAFGTTTFVFACYTAGVFGISATSPTNVVTGMALFYGGLAQFAAGMWAFRVGNTFVATALSSYGAFWLSYATILIPWFGVADGYVDAGYERDVAPAIAIFLLGWTLFTFLMWFGTLRTNAALIALFTSLTVMFLLLTIGFYKGPGGLKVKRAGGFFGIFTAILAWYAALAGILTHDNSFFTLPMGALKRRRS